MKRYERQFLLAGFGEEGQEKLARGSVLVIGAGGLGSPAALYLAAAGVGRIGIVDGDAVELSNLQRQILHATADLGRPKAVSAAESMRAINPHVIVEPHELFLDESNIDALVADYDFVVDATDNFDAKYLINDSCVRVGKPFVHAAVMAFSGQLLTYVPGQGPCYRCVFGEPPAPEEAPSAKRSGIMGAIAGVVGCLEAVEAIKYLSGIGELACGSLLVYDGLYCDFRKIPLAPARPDCPACGV